MFLLSWVFVTVNSQSRSLERHHPYPLLCRLIARKLPSGEVLEVIAIKRGLSQVFVSVLNTCHSCELLELGLRLDWLTGLG